MCLFFNSGLARKWPAVIGYTNGMPIAASLTTWKTQGLVCDESLQAYDTGIWAGWNKAGPSGGEADYR
ncbi:MAG: hypothetical protein JO154_25170 [Chitinophaga sp.]|uniref:hypothetical protein n=1 Tax=Chitinophaga sp. TaxID=1869181 RepID=UPI0025BC274B|nr:hypothetical protein [Chitinophaga sp.]MBV8255911.1 hypothetical protein [Chitinophaga sp.]